MELSLIDIEDLIAFTYGILKPSYLYTKMIPSNYDGNGKELFIGEGSPFLPF